MPVSTRQDDVKVGEMVQTAVQTDAASQSTARTNQVTLEAGSQQDAALEAEEAHVSDGSRGAAADTAAKSADGSRPEAGRTAGNEQVPAARQDDVEVKSLVLPEAVQDPTYVNEEHNAMSGAGTGHPSVSPPSHEQQVTSVPAPRAEHQQLSDTADAVLDEDGLDSISSSPLSFPVTTQSGAGPELLLVDDSSPHDATLSELGDAAAGADTQPAAECLAPEVSERAMASQTPGSPATAMPMSSAASPDVLSALGSVGSDASLSGLSLGADSMDEPELDQLSLDGLDDAASSPVDEFLAIEVSAKTIIASAAPENLVPDADTSDVRAEGLSGSEVDFDSAGELSEPQLASALLPPPAQELQPPAALEPPLPAPVSVARGTSSEAAAAADPELLIPDAVGDPAAASQPFSARAARDEVGATDALHNHDDVQPWEAALTAAEAVEAELLQGTVPTRKTTVRIKFLASRHDDFVSAMLCAFVPRPHDLNACCMLTAGVSAGYEAVTASAEEQLAASQEALSTAEGPTTEAVLPDGSELGSANLGRTYTHAALQEVFSAQRAKVHTFDQPDRLLDA